MNDSKNSSNGLLVLRMGRHLTDAETQALMDHITPTADRLGLDPMVVPAGADVELRMGSSALLERVCVALEEIAAQGRMPEVSEAQIAPQALNARQPSEKEIVAALSKSYAQIPGLNQRPPRRNPGPDHG